MLISCLLLLTSLAADDLPSRLAVGDDAFDAIDYPSAIESYSVALGQHPDDPEVLWRLARAYVCKGEMLEGDQRTADCRQAEQYARKCIERDSLKAEGHCWLAASLSYIALDAGRKDQVRLSHELLREADRALALNPNDDAAYSIKGSFFRALGNVSWLQRQLAAIFIGRIPRGGYEEAEAALKKAIELAPDVMRHQYELGVLYLDMDRKEEAREVLQRAAALPVRVAIDRPRLKKIKELLGSLSEDKR